MTEKVWEFHSTENIIFGVGSIKKIEQVIEDHEARNVLIITDQGIKNAGILDQVLHQINEGKYNVQVYDQAIPEPPISSVVKTYDETKDKIHADLIIGLGGGSSIDLAKLVALLFKYGGHPRDYMKAASVPGPTIPVLAIPTTAGTGTEVTPVAVVTDEESNLKVGISDNYLRPSVALLDPSLTINLPAYVTACSGIDALSHAIESYTAIGFESLDSSNGAIFQGSFPLTETLSIEAIKLISKSLARAVYQGNNIEARSNLLLGSLLAGMAFSNAGNSLAHALAYPIGGIINSPHGEVTGLLLPHTMRYNSIVLKEKMSIISKIFKENSNAEGHVDPADFVENLLADIGLPTKLSEIGIERESLDHIAEETVKIERLTRNNPRKPNKKDLLELLEKAY